MNQTQTILKQTTRKETDKIQIISAPVHERVQGSQSLIPNTDWWLLKHETFVKWKENQCPLPSNFHLLPNMDVPIFVEPDVIICQNIFSQFQLMQSIAQRFGNKMIRVEHTTPTALPNYSPRLVETMKLRFDANINVFITDYNREMWGFGEEDNSFVIKHGLDSNLFKPIDKERKNQILVVANDLINRGKILGLDIIQKTCQGLPLKIIGNTKGVSQPASSLQELLNIYNESLIFLNTSQASPIPISSLEAALMGCAIVSTDNCAIKEFFDDECAFLSNDILEIRKYLEHLLSHPQEAVEKGIKARKRIKERCNLQRFIKEWKSILQKC